MLKKLGKGFNDLMIKCISFSFVVLGVMVFAIFAISTQKTVYKYKDVHATVISSSFDEVRIGVSIDKDIEVLTDQVIWYPAQSEEGYASKISYDEEEKEYIIKIDRSDKASFDEAQQIIKNEKELMVKIPYKRVLLWHRVLEYLRLEE